MTEPAPKRMTYAEYLEADAASEVKLEYVDGRAVAMTGGSMRHAATLENLYFCLRRALEGRACTPMGSERRLWIPLFEQSRYPDGMVVCDDPQYDDPDDPQAVLNPTVVFEVLSPSTEGTDRGEKSAEYRSIPSVRQVVFIDPRTRRIEVLTRADDAWVLRDVTAAGPLELTSIGVSLDVAELWKGVPPRA